MKIYTVVTFNDWVAHYGTWGEPGVERVFDVLKIAGIERVYWRAFDGGLADYPSKTAPLFDGRKLANVTAAGDGGGPQSWRSYAPVRNDAWDALAAAVRVGQRRGIEVCAWLTVYEEDHGGNFGGPFAGRPDLCQRDREGRVYPGTVEFFYPEIQEHKFAIVRELLERGVHGVLLDFARHNAIPSAGPDGVHRFGYNPEICEAFRKENGRDPRSIPSDDPAWLAFKNRYQTDFVRKLRTRIGAKRRLDLMLWPVNNPRWLCLDVPALAREKAVDMLCAFNLTYSFSPGAMRAQYRSLKSQTQGTNTEIAPGIQAYFGIEPEEFESAVAAAESAGARSVMLYESDHLVGARLTASARAIHLGASRCRREVKVRSLSRVPVEADWKRAKKQGGFFIIAGADRAMASAGAMFSLLKSPRALHCRLFCRGRQTDAPWSETDLQGGGVSRADVLKAKKVYIDALGARMYWLGADRGHLLLDARRSRRDFVHFVIGRNGDRLQQTNRDNSWTTKWKGIATRMGAEEWMAEWEIPFRSLGVRPEKGDRWGFQVVREHAATHEISAWFISATPSCDGVRAGEWGDLVFV